ncbi:MAG: host-nuclease inhibitor Gam family protein [Deltaproteobacteria bacterium]|nr:host-nuclease inhibitor Gam family protein [Deltaproteobacteria bacterium]
MKKRSTFNVQGSTVKKRRVIPAKAGIQEIKADADNRLAEIKLRTADINDLRAEAETEMRKVTERYALRLEAREVLLKSAITALMQVMKFNKKILFDGTDVVKLKNGSLIRNVGNKVTIPHNALEACEINGFDEVIKIVKSLDRDAIEQWPDAKLVLIGAERKPKEEFKYDIKRDLQQNKI